jgi:hypothetical protein
VRRVRWFVRAAIVIGLCACARISLGAAPGAKSTARRVELMVGAPATEAELLAPSIREMLVAKGLNVVTARKPVVTAQDVAAAIAPPNEAVPSLARVLVDLTFTGQATLFLIDPPRGRVYVRRMELPRGLDAVARASVRFVIEQSIDAILEGREIGVSRDEYQRGVQAPPAPTPTAEEARARPAPAPARIQRHLAAGYEAVAMGSGEFQRGGKLAVAARFERVVIALAVRVATPISIAGDGTSTRLFTVGVSASAAGRFLNLGGFALLAGLGAGLDFTRVAPAVTTPDLQAAPAFWATAPSLRPFAAIERFFGRLSVAIAAGVEVHLLDERYTVRTGTETREVFVPGRARPEVEASIGVAF